MPKSRTCPRDSCNAPDTICVNGLDPSACPDFKRVEPDLSSEVPAAPGTPWSGLALGAGDLPAVAATGITRLVVPVGLHNSGKTTALAATIISLRRGSRANGLFAGSYTLLGWQQIARHLQWAPHGSGFPPHTTSADQRVPALLHIALMSDRARVNVLYADVPGEWFRNWAYDEAASEGVTWLAANADSFVLFADSEALAGPDRGEAAGHYGALASRLAHVAQGRPVVPIRAKADIDIAEPIAERIAETNDRLFGQETMEVSVIAGAGHPITEPVETATSAALAPTPSSPTIFSSHTDPLLAYGATSASSS